MNDPSKNAAFDEYERLTIHLHRLMAVGKSESEEADSVRDAMDGPWKRLTGDERRYLDGLSSDLYMLSGDELPEIVSPSDVEARRREIMEARRSLDALRMLALLRVGPPVLSIHDVAAMRAWAYDALGRSGPAQIFMGFATNQVYLSGKPTRHLRISFGHRMAA